MAWVAGSASWALAHAAKSQQAAAKTETKALVTQGKKRGSVDPFVKMDSACVFPRGAGQGVQMPREHLGIHTLKPVVEFLGLFCRVGILRTFYAGIDLGGPLLFHGGPVEALQVEKGKA